MEDQVNIQLAQIVSAPVPEPVALGIVLIGLAFVWFRKFQLVPATRRRSRVAQTDRNSGSSKPRGVAGVAAA